MILSIGCLSKGCKPSFTLIRAKSSLHPVFLILWRRNQIIGKEEPQNNERKYNLLFTIHLCWYGWCHHSHSIDFQSLFFIKHIFEPYNINSTGRWQPRWGLIKLRGTSISLEQSLSDRDDIKEIIHYHIVVLKIL